MWNMIVYKKLKKLNKEIKIKKKIIKSEMLSNEYARMAMFLQYLCVAVALVSL